MEYIEFNEYKKKAEEQRKENISSEIHKFINSLPNEWDGVTSLCDFVSYLGTKKYPLPDILYAIGNDSHLFFWTHLLISSLSLEELDQLIQTFNATFPKEECHIQELKLFYVTNQYEKIGLSTSIDPSLLLLPSHQGNNNRAESLMKLRLSYVRSLVGDLQQDISSYLDTHYQTSPSNTEGHA